MDKSNHIIVSVHGIRTFGHWQPRLASLVQQANPNVVVFNYVFGYFSIIAFLIPPLRWLVTRRFQRELERLSHSERNTRIDLVGHSFGTHLIGWGISGLPRERRPRVHTVILAGSVLLSDFDWSTLIEDGTVQRIINDCGTKDSILILNQIFVLFTGMAGRLGFHGLTGENFVNRYFAGGHSLYFETAEKPSDNFMTRYWIPLLVDELPIERIDQRQTPTWIEGVITTALQNLNAIKLAVYTVLLLTPALIFSNLYHEAEIQRERADYERDQALETLEWVFNETALVPFDSVGLDNKTIPIVEGIVVRLKCADFEGTIVIIGHLGDYIGIQRANGEYEIATKDKLKHLRPGDSTLRISREYALALHGRFTHQIKKILKAHGLPDSIVILSERERNIVPYPVSDSDVDEWNRVAALNNRIEIRLLRKKIGG